MKKILLIIIATFCLLGITEAKFSGSIKYEVKADGSEITMTNYVTGDKSAIKLQVSGMNIKVLYQMPKRIVMIMEDQNMAMELDIAKVKELAKVQGAEESKLDIKGIKKTGKTKKIAGQEAEEYEVTVDNEIITLWVSKEFGDKLDNDKIKNLMQLTDPAGMRNSTDELSLASIGILAMYKGTAVSIEATEVSNEAKPLDFFEVPANITVMPMPTGIGGGQDSN